MSNVDSEAKKVWKFSCEEWENNPLEGTFVASQDEIDWITGQVINFGDAGKGLDIEVRMESDLFEVINDDADFANQFKATVGALGDSPFDMLDDEQFATYELKFGEGKVDEELVGEFVDEGTRVITYGITDEIMIDDTANSREQEEMDRFLSLFEVVDPQGYAVHLGLRVDRYDNGDLNCMKVIKRKSDGALFGYRYSETHGEEYYYSNGEKHGLGSKYHTAYVWFPVKPFTITGYTFDMK